MNNQKMAMDSKSKMLSVDPLEAIRELSFVKLELEEYLDTHPSCKTAIDYYHQTIDALASITEKYHSTNHPIVAAGSTNTEYWDWVNSPWPWHNVEHKNNAMERSEK